MKINKDCVKKWEMILKEIYEKAEEILDWAYGISESNRKQQ